MVSGLHRNRQRAASMVRRISFVILALAVLTGYQPVNSQKSDTFNGFELVDPKGNIRKPADYRDHYQSLGTCAVLYPRGNELHVVDAAPGASENFRKHGKIGVGRA